MGGAGGTVYETPDGPRSGAYLASRIARDVVERRMMDLLVPDWNLKGEAAAEDLRRSVQEALQERLAELKAPPERAAVTAAPRPADHDGRGRPAADPPRRVDLGLLTCSGPATRGRTCSSPTGLRQLSTDDLRDPATPWRTCTATRW